MLQRYFIPFAFVISSALFCWTLANPVSKSDPGHMVIPYYQKRHQEVQKLNHETLRYRCESQLRDGYVSDRKCQEWFEVQFSSAAAVSVPRKCSSMVALSVLLILRHWM